MVPAFEDWQKLKRVGVTGRVWGIWKGSEGEQCCEGTAGCWALTTKAVSRRKQKNSPPCIRPLRAAGKGAGYSGIRRAQEGLGPGSVGSTREENLGPVPLPPAQGPGKAG